MKNIDELLKIAIVNNNINFLSLNRHKYNINHRFADENNDTLLLYSISDPKSYAYRYFLNNDADISLENDEGENVIHSIVFSGLKERLREVLDLSSFDEKLINSRTKDGYTPLMLSVLLEKCDIFDYLLEIGADANIADMENNTPLHPACSLGYMNMVKKLVERGADLHIKTQKGNYPLALAVNGDHDEIVRYLFDAIYN